MLVVRVLSALLIAGCLMVAVAQAARAPAPRAPRRATAEERARIAQRLAALESSWLGGARRTFPGDRWSESDHFHNMEQMAVRREAALAGVATGDVLLAIDESLRRAPGNRPVSAAPCKPRPFYQ